MADELKLDDDLEGLSAEDLEKLIEQDDGKAELEVDNQNFVTEGIDELNAEPGDEEPPNKEEPEPKTEEPEPEVDYEAKYNETMAILAQQKLLEAQEIKVPPAKEPEPELTGDELYKRAAKATKLSAEEQAKFNSFKEYDEDQADLYKKTLVTEKLLADIYKNQQVTEQAAATQAATTKAAEEKSWNDVISDNKNMKSWQQDPEEWDAVNNVFKVVSRSKGFNDLSKTEQISLVEKRYLAATGQTVTEAPPPAPEPKPVSKPKGIDEKVAAAEKVKPPSSLSSVSGTKETGKPGRIKVDNGSDATDLQMMFDNADPNDPEAIDKIMSSMDYGT